MFVGVLATPLETAQQEKIQHTKSARGEESKTKTLQRVKVQHEIVRYIKRVQHKKVQLEMVQYEKCNMKRVQHEKCAT